MNKIELSYLFWCKYKAKTLKKTGVGEQLKKYELATEKFDNTKKLKVLLNLKKTVSNAISLCKSYHSETKKILEAYIPLIDEQIGITQTAIRKGGSGSSSSAPKQKLEGPVVIWERDIDSEIKGTFQKRHLQFPDWLIMDGKSEIKLTLNKDILDVLEKEKDYTTPAFMVEDAQKYYQDAVNKIVGLINDYISRETRLTPEIIVQINKKRESELIELKKNLKLIPQERWNKFVKRRSQYKAYKVKSGVDLTVSVLSTTLSGMAIASAVPTGGAGLILGIINGVRSVAGLSKQCYDLAIEAEFVQKNLKADLDKLQSFYKSAYEKASKAKIVATEVTMAAIKGILNVDTPFVPTVSKCKKNKKLLENKVAGLAVKGKELTNKLVDLLSKAEKMEAKMKKAESKKDAMKILDYLRKIRESVTNTFDKAAGMNARVKKMDEESLPEVEKILNELSKDVPKYVDVFERTWHATVNVGLAVGTGAVGLDSATTALKDANASVQMSRKLLAELKKQGEIELVKRATA